MNLFPLRTRNFPVPAAARVSELGGRSGAWAESRAAEARGLRQNGRRRRDRNLGLHRRSRVDRRHRDGRSRGRRGSPAWDERHCMDVSSMSGLDDISGSTVGTGGTAARPAERVRLAESPGPSAVWRYDGHRGRLRQCPARRAASGAASGGSAVMGGRGNGGELHALGMTSVASGGVTMGGSPPSARPSCPGGSSTFALRWGSGGSSCAPDHPGYWAVYTASAAAATPAAVTRQ